MKQINVSENRGEQAQAFRSLGLLNRKQRQPAAAVAYFRQAAALDPADHVSLVNLAELFQENRDKKHAIEYYIRAVIAAPRELAYQKKFLVLATDTIFETHNDGLQQALTVCLTTSETECAARYTLWHNMLALDPAFASLYRLKDGVFDKKLFERAKDYTALLSPYFLALLKRLVVTGIPGFENFLISVRRRLLEDLRAPKKMFSRAEERASVAAALSHYCLATDHIFYVDKDENEILSGLRERIEAGAATAGDIAVYACYKPLYTLKNAATLSVPEIEEVITAQIGDYLALQEARKSIVLLTEIADATSKKVREQYEEFPYPRWERLPVFDPEDKSGMVAYGDKKETLRKPGIKILLAGCGTGQEPLALAQAFPQADILAVDLSTSSLAYAVRKAAEYKITNVMFRQGDILQLGTLGQTFDCIVSSGVLHHMDDPMKGWRVLCGLLKPDGLMRIALYSLHARRHILAAREAIAREGYGADADSMKLFRRKSTHLLGAETLANLRNFNDYYSLPMYRDMLFHVQEENIDIPELERRLETLGLVFDGFSIDDVQIIRNYLSLYPDEKEALSLAKWDKTEKKYPDTFRAMYQFWCKKR